MIREILIIAFSYVIGCFNTGYYYVRLIYRRDIREVGTNVTGAYNVSRLSGRKGFIITFLGDAAKGAFPVVLCRLLGLNEIVTLICILMVLLGHIFPFQLKFKGGKGISTAFGAILVFQPTIMLFWLISFIVLLPMVRRFTITCLFALLLLPLELFIADYPIVNCLFMLLYALLILFACRNNLDDFIKERAYQGVQKKNKK